MRRRVVAQEVFGERAEHYVHSPVHKDREVLDRVREWSGPTESSMVLDLGTGTGHTAFALASHARCVIAADITMEMLVRTMDQASVTGVRNVRPVQVDARSLPFKPGTFDIITCRRAAHHFPRIDEALREMYDALSVGGRLVIDDRSVPEDDEVDETMNRLDVLHDASHVREYRRREWIDMLSAIGFDVEKVLEYRKHLPLSSLTANVQEGNARMIADTVLSLDDGLRTRMNIVEKDGVLHLDHYFITIQATK